MERGTDINLQYELPPLVAAVKSSYQCSLQSAATASSLLAGAAVQLMATSSGQTFPNAQKYPSLVITLSTVSYGAVFMNASAAVTSLILIDRLGRLLRMPAQRNSLVLDLEKGGYVNINDHLYLLEKYGAGRSWKWCLRHWFISLFLGIVFLFLQVFIYVFLQETELVIVILTGLILLYVSLSLVYFVWPVNQKEK
ncbi:hypothetical protein L218DRAFT_219550 [Marasmius fiardii PR-910]|nr:hypothetical protein L218DRAFT_219550 [Marasmius fiardii PR-910]